MLNEGFGNSLRLLNLVKVTNFRQMWSHWSQVYSYRFSGKTFSVTKILSVKPVAAKCIR